MTNLSLSLLVIDRLMLQFDSDFLGYEEGIYIYTNSRAIRKRSKIAFLLFL
jgi:hypothetical protein